MQIKDNLRKIKDWTLDLLFPILCINCGKEGRYICDDCSVFLSETANAFPGGNIKELVSIWEYEGLIKKLILKIKYDGVFDAVDWLTEKAFEIRWPYLPEGIIITFVPMSREKEKRRGFNQAELIARKIGKITARKVANLLKKTKNTPSQTELNKNERIKNVKDSFAFSSLIGLPENVLLIDDVWTSGATMTECARVLKTVGVKNIWGFTMARTI